MKRKIDLLLIVLLSTCWLTAARGQSPYPKDTIQAHFSAGKIASVNGNIASYRLNGLHGKGAYGYCIFDENYQPLYSTNITAFDYENGEYNCIFNSNCYTIIAPIFDYVLPFSEGWGAVCKDKKWSYVSKEGDFLCDLALDAAYPFKDGHAKVIYQGVPYEIDTLGNGLPSEVNLDTNIISKKLQSETIRQLYLEQQHEKAIEKGPSLYNSILNKKSLLSDIPSETFFAALLAEQCAINSQNTLLALYVQHFKDLYDYYQNIVITKRFSMMSGYPELNHHVGLKYISLLKNKHPNDTVFQQIYKFVDERNYKSALVCFENWNDSITTPLELAVYFYMAELSDDFETANSLLPSIASDFEENSFKWIDDPLLKGHLFACIQKTKTAYGFLSQATEQAEAQNDILAEVVGYYTTALLYHKTGAVNDCNNFFAKAISLINNDIHHKIPSTLKNEILFNYLDCLLLEEEHLSNYHHALMQEYVESEIAFYTNLYLTEDMAYANRFWNNGVVRIRKFLRHMPNCQDPVYRKNAFKLALFQNDLINETEKWLLKGIANTDNSETKKMAKEYFALKQNYKGFDIYDLEKEDKANYETSIRINNLEKRIKLDLKDDNPDATSMASLFFNPFEGMTDDNILLYLFEFDNDFDIKEYGIMASIGNMTEIHYIPLGKWERFYAETIWERLLNVVDITEQSHCYFCLGKYDYFGIEYELIDGEIAYFKYDLHRVASLLHINKGLATEFDNNIALFGGLDYGIELIAQHRGNVDNGYLKFSKIEIDSITEIMQDVMNVMPYSQHNGTVDNFLQFNRNSPEILHFSTHGYQHELKSINYTNAKQHSYRERFNYYRQNTDIEDLNWLMNKTGLFLSINENENDTTNILLSREVAACDLHDTRLVVLSACSTVLGVSSDSHTGSIGLTSAFVMANTQNIITSLQDVNDQKSCEFMVYFYKQLKETKNIYSSFKKTIQEMRTRYPQKKEYWGSFVLIENH